ncbi:mutS protein homolog 4-like [Prorops nasuta]|uniref:mutS protein homolog 4-like n=1 Tax=Prorops nasuta TaxID=863751 RepID=UPI0034CF73EE
MNVMRNYTVPSRGQGKRKGQGRYCQEQINNVLPKYQFDNGFRKPLLHLSANTNIVNKTPINSRKPRLATSTSTSCAPSSSHRGTTPGNLGTTTPGSITTNNDSCVIVAITSGRGDARCEVGMAAINVKYPHLILCQISDFQTYINSLTKIYIFDPIEIIMPDTMCNNGNYANKLYSTIGEKFPNLCITPVSRIHFSERIGMERIKTHCANEFSSVEIFVKQKYYALSAAAALLKYVEYIQHILYAPKSMKIEFQGSQNTTVIDVESAKALELVTSQIVQSNICLLGTMDHCCTPMGRRLLRASILQPPCRLKLIAERQSCVKELVTNGSFRSVVQGVVRKLYGADRLLIMATKPVLNNSLQTAEHNLNYVLLLKNSMDIVPELKASLASGSTLFFDQVRKNLENESFPVIKKKILKIINPESRAVKGYTSANMQRCFAIRSGLNDLLDIARQTYCELIDDMKSLVESLAEKYSISMALSCNPALGYHIEAAVPKNPSFKISDLPSEFIEVQKHRNSLYMTTSALLVLSQQCKVSCEEVHVMSNVLLTDLIEDIREHIGCLFQLSADVAELDLIISLAELSCMPNYVLPTFGPKLCLSDSMHPVMLSINEDRPVPNDVKASPGHNFHLITGPNMSGKSVYLKQIVLLQIMAQIGCYVPASSAEFRIADKIFCKISFCDDIECNASTFVLEVKEAQYILQSVTQKSLIILDELCRATTVEEGCSIAWCISEHLLNTSAFTFCATHFSHLTKLAEIYYNVSNYCFETVMREFKGARNPRLLYTHKLKRGKNLLDCHGISLSEMSGIPKIITLKAREYAAMEYENKKPNNENEEIPETWLKLIYSCVVRMYELLEKNMFNKEYMLSIIESLRFNSSPEVVDKSELINNAYDNIVRAVEMDKNVNKKETKNESEDDSDEIIRNKLSLKTKSLSRVSQVKGEKLQDEPKTTSEETLSSRNYCPMQTLKTSEGYLPKSISTSEKSDLLTMESFPISWSSSAVSSNMQLSENVSSRHSFQPKSVSQYTKNYFSRKRSLKTEDDSSLISQICSNPNKKQMEKTSLLSQDPTILVNFNDVDSYIGADRISVKRKFDLEFSHDLSRQFREESSDSFIENFSETLIKKERNYKQSITDFSDVTSMESKYFTTERKPKISSTHKIDTEIELENSELHEYCVPSNFYDPSFSNMTVSSNVSITSGLSRDSIATTVAKSSARRKEAEIFKKIEGDLFNEEEFFQSMDSVIDIIY